MSTEDVTIPASAVFYVRSALHRAVSGLREQIESAEDWLASDEAAESPGVFRESVRNMTAYNRQLLDESMTEFGRLPEAIQPPNV